MYSRASSNHCYTLRCVFPPPPQGTKLADAKREIEVTLTVIAEPYEIDSFDVKQPHKPKSWGYWEKPVRKNEPSQLDLVVRTDSRKDLLRVYKDIESYCQSKNGKCARQTSLRIV